MDIRYLWEVWRHASFAKFFSAIDRVHEKSGKLKLIIFFDMIACMIAHGAGYYDYLIYGLWAANHQQRKTYITRMRNKRLNTTLNKAEDIHLFENKHELFPILGAKYMGREYLDTKLMSRDDFDAFIRRHETIIAKPTDLESGKGIEKLRHADFATLDEFYTYVLRPDKRFRIIEELLVQHEAMAKPYPPSINCLRIVTLVADGVAHCLYVTYKMGNKGGFVDNIENGGLACPVDMETGRITGVAHTTALINYEAHPFTGVRLVGYQLPMVPEAVALCKEAAMLVPGIRYVGWDVCVTPERPVIIEGNTYPGYVFCQEPEWTPDHIGMWGHITELVPELR